MASYYFFTLSGNEFPETVRAVNAPAMKRCPKRKMQSFKYTTFWRALSSKWIPLCSKSNKNNSITCFSSSSRGVISPFSETFFSVSYNSLWVFNLNEKRMNVRVFFWKNFESIEEKKRTFQQFCKCWSKLLRLHSWMTMRDEWVAQIPSYPPLYTNYPTIHRIFRLFYVVASAI